MSDTELAARIVLRLSASPGFEDIRGIARDELRATDDGQVGAVAQRLYERGWLERLNATPEALEAKLDSKARAIAQQASLEELTCRFERGGSLVVDPAPRAIH